MLWFRWKTLSGSQARLRAASRGELRVAVDGAGHLGAGLGVLVRVAARDARVSGSTIAIARRTQPRLHLVVGRVFPCRVGAHVEPGVPAGERHRVVRDPRDGAALDRDRERAPFGPARDVLDERVEGLRADVVGVGAQDVRPVARAHREVVRGLDLEVRLAAARERDRLRAAPGSGRDRDRRPRHRRCGCRRRPRSACRRPTPGTPPPARRG